MTRLPIELMTRQDEEIPSLPLKTRRKILGYIVPILNLPILAWKVYSIYTDLTLSGLIFNEDLVNNMITITLALVLLILVPQNSPLYVNQYWFTPIGIKLVRFLKRTKIISYESIYRLDFYIRDERKGKPSSDALQFGRDAVNELRRSGFKFSDYTNDETVIALLFSDQNVDMITPADPKKFYKTLNKRVKKLSIKTIILAFRGYRVKNSPP